MSIQTRLKNIEEKITQEGMSEKLYVVFSKGASQLFNRDGSEFQRPSGFDKTKDVVCILDWSLKI